MIVFEYLYEMMDTFGSLMDRYANGEDKLIDSKEVSKYIYIYSRYNTYNTLFLLSYLILGMMMLLLMIMSLLNF